MIRRYLNGETRQRKPLSACSEYIAVRGEPGELETSKYPEGRERKFIDFQSSGESEMERAQTVMRALRGSDCVVADVR